MELSYSENDLSEVYAILEDLGEEYIYKIPNKFYEYIKTNKNNNYKPVIDFNKDLEKQISDQTLNFIAYLNIQYWCNEKEKQELIEQYSENDKKYEEELSKQFDYEDIFKNKKKTNTYEDKENMNSVAIVKYNKSLISKIIEKIKSIFRNTK